MPRASTSASSSTNPADAASYDWHYLCKFILIGDSSVGKSALLLRVTDDRFLAEEAEPTVGVEFGTVTIPLPSTSERVKLQLWDTAGSEAFRGITRSYYRGAAGCLLMYDVTHRSSFLNAQNWLKDVREHAEEDAVVILVGNRVDLVDEDETQRKVTEKEAKKWADEQGILFVETSAKTGHNVRPAFEQCVSEIHRRFTSAQQQSSSERGSSTTTSAASAKQLLKSRTGGPGGASSSSAGGRRGGQVGPDGHVRLGEGDDAGHGGAMGQCCCVM